MIPQVKKDILAVLKETEMSIARGDTVKLKELSDHTIHNSFIYQDEDSISIAVIIYSLYKVYDVPSLNTGAVVKLLKHAGKHLERDELQKYKGVIRRLSRLIAGKDSKFKHYIQDVIERAEIKKGSKLYYHGISIAQAANLLGISQWELMSYVGKTKISDTAGISDVNDRLNFARRLFLR
ncbi:hypothetical protein HYY72_01950 [Candidatus Woesearchaeota archaeon]|nr:hypothetical protein [Candidatus Woesearchaeota archaeon]